MGVGEAAAGLGDGLGEGVGEGDGLGEGVGLGEGDGLEEGVGLGAGDGEATPTIDGWTEGDGVGADSAWMPERSMQPARRDADAKIRANAKIRRESINLSLRAITQSVYINARKGEALDCSQATACLKRSRTWLPR